MSEDLLYVDDLSPERDEGDQTVAVLRNIEDGFLPPEIRIVELRFQIRLMIPLCRTNGSAPVREGNYGIGVFLSEVADSALTDNPQGICSQNGNTVSNQRQAKAPASHGKCQRGKGAAVVPAQDQ